MDSAIENLLHDTRLDPHALQRAFPEPSMQTAMAK
jgi:hypothetical protein